MALSTPSQKVAITVLPQIRIRPERARSVPRSACGVSSASLNQRPNRRTWTSMQSLPRGPRGPEDGSVAPDVHGKAARVGGLRSLRRDGRLGFPAERAEPPGRDPERRIDLEAVREQAVPVQAQEVLAQGQLLLPLAVHQVVDRGRGVLARRGHVPIPIHVDEGAVLERLARDPLGALAAVEGVALEAVEIGAARRQPAAVEREEVDEAEPDRLQPCLHEGLLVELLSVGGGRGREQECEGGKKRSSVVHEQGYPLARVLASGTRLSGGRLGS